jgi:hypothetical protein
MMRNISELYRPQFILRNNTCKACPRGPKCHAAGFEAKLCDQQFPDTGKNPRLSKSRLLYKESKCVTE